MARPFHLPILHHRVPGGRPAHLDASLVLILLLALLAALWMKVPPAASLLPIHPPG
jgi:hypothetical protein